MTSLEYAYARQHSHGFQKMKACKYGANLNGTLLTILWYMGFMLG